jgi:apolipoprotein N-acyltransferase
MKVIILAVLAIMSFCSADPIFGFWPGMFISMGLYVEVHRRICGSGKKSLWIGTLFSFIYYFSIKLFTIRGLYAGFTSLYGDKSKGLLSFLVFLAVDSLLPTVSGFFTQLLFKKKDHFLFPLFLFALLFVTNLFSYIWIPQGIEIPLAQSPQLLSFVGFAHIKGLLLWFFTVTLCINFLVWKKSFRRKEIFILLAAWVVFPFIAGSMRKKFIMEAGNTSVPILLVQTNQSELREKLNPVDWDAIHTNVFPKLSGNRIKHVFFPEYTSRSDNPYLEKFVTSVHEMRPDLDIYMGIESNGNVGLKNEVWHFKGKEVAAKFSKKIAFPIGETEISLPFLPREWTKPRVEMEDAKNSQIPLLGDIQLIPMICYEAAISEHYSAVTKLVDTTRPSIIVNFSKDSHLQGSSALDWLDYFIRLKSSELGKTTIRISTNSYTEIITPWGEVVSKSGKDQFQLIETDLPVYAKTYSLWFY